MGGSWAPDGCQDRSGGASGELLGRSSRLLGHSWRLFGPFRGRAPGGLFGASLDAPAPEAEKATPNLLLQRFLNVFWSNNYNYTEDEFELYIELQTGTILTLREMLNDDMITDADDPTATRLRFEPTGYDINNTKLKVVFDMVIDNYDSNGDAIKKVAGINYLVNLTSKQKIFLS